ncbi:MAG: class I SAM-dependent methyltransferase [Caldilineaceae bacterium]
MTAPPQRHPDGMLVNLGCGLDTRFQRLDDGVLELTDLDLPTVIALKRALLPEEDRYRMIASSILDFAWMDLIPARGRRILFLAEGVFMYLPESDVRNLVLTLQQRFPGCELLCEVFNRKWLEGWASKA